MLKSAPCTMDTKRSSQYKDVFPVKGIPCSLTWESHTWEKRSLYWDGAQTPCVYSTLASDAGKCPPSPEGLHPCAFVGQYLHTVPPWAVWSGATVSISVWNLTDIQINWPLGVTGSVTTLNIEIYIRIDWNMADTLIDMWIWSTDHGLLPFY